MGAQGIELGGNGQIEDIAVRSPTPSATNRLRLGRERKQRRPLTVAASPFQQEAAKPSSKPRRAKTETKNPNGQIFRSGFI